MELVSIIIPTYCGSDCIRRAVNSVINQTYKNIEIIIVDDNNPDSVERIKTSQIVYDLISKFPNSSINYIKHDKNLNGAFARNTGLHNANGDIICFLDDDDVYLPKRIENTLLFMKNNNVDIVLTNVAICRGSKLIGFVNPDSSLNYVESLLLNMNYLGTGSNIFIRRKVVTTIDGFDVNFSRMQDVEFMIRAFEKFRVGKLDEVLIVKSTGGADNRPSYFKYMLIRTKFDLKFKYLLDNLNDEKKNIYFRNEKLYYLFICIGREKRSVLNKLICEIKKDYTISYSYKMKVLFSKIGFGKCNLYNLANKLFVPLRNFTKDFIIGIKNNKEKKKIKKALKGSN